MRGLLRRGVGNYSIRPESCSSDSDLHHLSNWNLLHQKKKEEPEETSTINGRSYIA
jgi:hypothetical protein